MTQTQSRSMTDDELVERMAKVMALQPWDELHPGSKARLLSDARAALAVAEPVIRERCAKVAEREIAAVLVIVGSVGSAIRTGATP